MILAADNIQAMNPVVAEALERLDPRPIRELAQKLAQSGARRIDINPGYLSRGKQDRMAFLVETVQEVTDLPLILDSPQPGVLIRGLEVVRNQATINALSLEKQKIEEIPGLAVEYQADLVLLLMDERSMPPFHLEEKLSLALELRQVCLDAGLKEEQLIYDPVLPSLSWPDAFARTGEVIRTVRMLSSGAVLGSPTRTMAGISNLLSGLRNQYPVEIETTCLTLLAGAGLDMALANLLRPEIMATAGMIDRMG